MGDWRNFRMKDTTMFRTGELFIFRTGDDSQSYVQSPIRPDGNSTLLFNSIIRAYPARQWSISHHCIITARAMYCKDGLYNDRLHS